MHPYMFMRIHKQIYTQPHQQGKLPHRRRRRRGRRKEKGKVGKGRRGDEEEEKAAGEEKG